MRIADDRKLLTDSYDNVTPHSTTLGRHGAVVVVGLKKKSFFCSNFFDQNDEPGNQIMELFFVLPLWSEEVFMSESFLAGGSFLHSHPHRLSGLDSVLSSQSISSMTRRAIFAVIGLRRVLFIITPA